MSDLSTLRHREFSRLDATGSVYLDYTGAALYPESLVANHARRLTTQVLGNPHSDSAPSQATTASLARARHLTLRFLDADPSEYDVVFTANATGAIRIVAETFPFQSGSRLVLTADNHNSVNGLRIAAQRRRAAVDYVPLDAELRAPAVLEHLSPAAAPSLLAFPAQSNFSGVQHPLTWIAAAQRNGYQVLLDAAAFLPATPLSLRTTQPDFVALSYYKLFGYPTGVGALVARHEALALLRQRRRYFGGGAVQFVSVQNRLARLRSGSGAFEDGTPNFLAMDAVSDGLEWLQRIGMANIQEHVSGLTNEMLSRLNRYVEFYGPGDGWSRGSTVAFNLRKDGRVLPFEDIEAAARLRGIAVRGGCFCNPGAAEAAFGIPANEARSCLRTGEAFTIPRFRTCLEGRAVGAVRASWGIANTHSDVDVFIDLIQVLAQSA